MKVFQFPDAGNLQPEDLLYVSRQGHPYRITGAGIASGLSDELATQNQISALLSIVEDLQQQIDALSGGVAPPGFAFTYSPFDGSKYFSGFDGSAYLEAVA